MNSLPTVKKYRAHSTGEKSRKRTEIMEMIHAKNRIQNWKKDIDNRDMDYKVGEQKKKN